MRKIFILISLVLLLLPQLAAGSSIKWRELKQGLVYASAKAGDGTIHAFKLDPARYDLNPVTAADFGRVDINARQMAESSRALLAINGGYFTPEYKSLGLLVRKGKELNKLKSTSWWAVFYLENGVPRIVHTKDYGPKGKVSMAIQAGPRLLINGEVPRLKDALAARSALCTTRDDQVIIVATENMVLSLTEFAEYLKKPEKSGGLGCYSALNLDGGTSTQLYAKIGSFDLEILGLKNVANGIAVVPK